jgi:hypothetical protein
MTPICAIEGCKAHAAAKGLCSKHYMRTRRHGDPNQVKPPGAPCDVALNAWKTKLRAEVGPLVSERTFHRYCSATKILERLGLTQEDMEEIRKNEATRPNGSFNVSKFVAYTDQLRKDLDEFSRRKPKRGRPFNLDNKQLLDIADFADEHRVSRRHFLRRLFKEKHGRDATEEDVARYETQIRRARQRREVDMLSLLEDDFNAEL